MRTTPLVVSLAAVAAICLLVAAGVIGFAWIVLGPVAVGMLARAASGATNAAERGGRAKSAGTTR